MSFAFPPASRADAVRDLERERVRAETSARLFGGASPPVRVGRFELRRLLGSGANGVVYAARDPRLERDVALKLLTSDGDDHRLLAEARALARLAHPNVLPVYEADTAGGLVFIVSELVDGGTLRRWADVPRTRAERLRVLVGTARGIAAGHARGLVHRDIKPENVLVGVDGRPRVADFGLAAADEAAIDGGGGVQPGTLRYMAPEQMVGERADPSSDQFSFCVVAWELLTGAPPFAGDTPAILRDAILAQDLPERADPILGVLARGLRASRSSRHASVDALVAELERKPRPRAVVVGAVIGATVVLGASVAVAATALREPPPPTARASTQASVAGATGAASAAAARALPDPNEREREISVTASRMAEEGRYDDCARYLATRADTDALALLWLGCARVAKDPAELDRACDAWSAATRAPTGTPIVLECSPPVRAANKLLRAGDFRGCAEAILAAEPTLIGSITLATCTQRSGERSLYERQCRYQQMLPGGDPSKMEQCSKMP